MQLTQIHQEQAGTPPFLVVVGGSAGSIEALQTVVGGLPADLPASVIVVVHVGSGQPSALDRILDRAGPLPASTARDGEPMARGHIYVAPPDKHLILQDGHLPTLYGPRQNRSRPAIDPLFSSAARFDGRVIAIVLSGMLDDGTMGALLVKEAGGTVIVQSPADASFSSMPASAIAHAGANYVLPAAEIAGIVTALVSRGATDTDPSSPVVGPATTDEEGVMDRGAGPQQSSVETHDVVQDPLHRSYEPFALICPECGGAMISESRRHPLRFRCFLGHAFTSMSLWVSQLEYSEAQLWSALRAIEETAYLGHKMIDDARQGVLDDPVIQIAELEEQLAGIEQQIETVRAMLGAESTRQRHAIDETGHGTPEATV
jgi:two-component system, chemotaxis family, protein-glutamate methylesterase/glutaminase